MPRATTDAAAPPPPLSAYQELAPPRELRDLLVCRWRQQVVADRAQRVVPDGCVDLVWRAGRELIVAGPATRATIAALPAGSTTVGVRFAPGAGAGLAGFPLGELRDENVPLAQVWGEEAAARLEEALADAATAATQIELLEQAVVGRRALVPPADALVLAAVAAVGGSAGLGGAGRLGGARRGGGAWNGHEPRVRELSDALGIGERQLLRRFRAAVGYGPKTLARVLRFQRFLAAAWTDPAAATGGGLARLALDAGYADQAHLSRDCRELAGLPPRRLLRDG
ncbi:helix-turn-helix domain-containing protein [Conexibacter stalactiti]|uniref:Helix-turn-helix domain-containing protein n=1 Tax=Conexibacter stalactiti TaxID=1940611 RepID=A0ABU4HR18_9ACTN|nr:helix-turn-helix domain-containing protein [Conexibacter stalactiti]MDW5595199.1 helix-turn-helix domain-containing protein [Conexibacter stalactiti]MEC5035841.1 helix-turn-helix domain-containing protein [Conexibacter stalactiti]